MVLWRFMGKILRGKKLTVDLYADYYLMKSYVSINTYCLLLLNQTRNMLKLTVGYTTPKFSVGAEGFINTFNDQLSATTATATKDVLSPMATGISLLFTRGAIVPGKLGFFARFDYLNPNNKTDSSKYVSYASQGGTNVGSYTSAGFGKRNIYYWQGWILHRIKMYTSCQISGTLVTLTR